MTDLYDERIDAMMAREADLSLLVCAKRDTVNAVRNTERLAAYHEKRERWNDMLLWLANPTMGSPTSYDDL